MSSNKNQGSFLPFALVIALVAVAGVGLVLFNGSSSDEPATTDQQQTGEQQAQPQEGLAPQQNQQAETAPAGSEVGVTVTLISTDDPFYLSCVEKPLADGETREQRTAYCNKELARQQANQPTGQHQ